MKFSTFASVLAVAGLCVSTSQAATAEIGADFVSAYVPSGVTCNDRWVFQPWIDIYDLKIGDLELPIAFDVWANMDLEDYSDAKEDTDPGRFSEVDFQIRFDIAHYIGDDALTLYIGYLEYDYPLLGGDADNLLDAKVGYDFASGETALFNASLRLKYRFGGNSEGKYEVIADINRGFDLTEDIGLKVGADVVYVNVDDADNNVADENGEGKLDSGLACADIYASLSYGDFYVKCTYVAQIDDDVLPDGVYGYDVDWIAAIGWAHAF